ncbi:TPA: hypothetical protein ACGOWL_001769 [Streptococcus suis]
MNDFLDGLLHALSWDSEKTNVILGGHLSWPYVLGIVINFLVCLSVFILVVRFLVKNVKKSGGCVTIGPTITRTVFQLWVVYDSGYLCQSLY